MTKNKSFWYSVAFLSLSIPVQGRFIYGLVIVIELLLLELVGTLAGALAEKLKFREIKSYFVMLFLISFTILFRQILVLTYSEIALTLGFVLYFPTVSSYLLETLFSGGQTSLAQKLKSNLIQALKFSLLLLVFFLLRDIFGFGTFTFFGSHNRVFEKVLLNPDKIGIFMFFASIPGALILVGVLIYLSIFAKNKIYAYSREVEEAEKAKLENKEEVKK